MELVRAYNRVTGSYFDGNFLLTRQHAQHAHKSKDTFAPTVFFPLFANLFDTFLAYSRYAFNNSTGGNFSTSPNA